MKLLSCRIDGFGKLSGTQFEFHDGLTVLKEDNSFGKTTLANFIASMFYGLPDLKVKDLSNERRRYDPWQVSVYGGTLTFAYNGKQYRVERDFNKKGDAFRLTDVSGAVVKEIAELNGIRVDGGNFGDVLFGIDKNGFKRSAYIPQDEIVCGEIESGLSDKLRNFINATSETHSYQKSMELLQRAAEVIETKRGKGKLRETDERIAQLKETIGACEICFGNAVRGRERLAALKEELQALESEIEHMDAQLKQQNEAEALLARRCHYETIRSNAESCRQKTERLEAFFLEGAEHADIDGVMTAIVAFRKREKELRDIEAETLTERSRLHSLEEARLVRSERRKMLEAQAEGLKSDQMREQSEAERLNRETASLQAQKKRKGAVFMVLCVLTFGLYYIWASNQEKKRAVRLAEMERALQACAERLSSIEASRKGIAEQLEEIDRSAEHTDADRLAALDAQLAAAQAALVAAENTVKASTAPFLCKAEDYAERYHEIKDHYKQLAEARRDYKRHQAELEAFLKDTDIKALTEATEAKGVDTGLAARRNAADQKRLSLIREISDTEIRAMQDEDKADDLSNFESELSSCMETKERLTGEYETLIKTMRFLQEANESLANRYLIPLLEKTRTLLSGYDAQKSALGFDASAKVLLEEGGKERDLHYFSRGIKELVGICMRIALLDLIFTDCEQRPCILLDDPFVNLDDGKLKKAKEFIKSLSKTYQIIYLTCNSDRAI